MNAETWVDALIERYTQERIFDGRPDAVLRANLIKDVGALIDTLSVKPKQKAKAE